MAARPGHRPTPVSPRQVGRAQDPWVAAPISTAIRRQCATFCLHATESVLRRMDGPAAQLPCTGSMNVARETVRRPTAVGGGLFGSGCQIQLTGGYPDRFHSGWRPAMIPGLIRRGWAVPSSNRCRGYQRPRHVIVSVVDGQHIADLADLAGECQQDPVLIQAAGQVPQHADRGYGGTCAVGRN